VRKGSGHDHRISSGWHLFGAIFFSGLFQCRENFFAFGRTSCELKSRAVEGQRRGGALGCGNSLGSESVASAGKAIGQQATGNSNICQRFAIAVGINRTLPSLTLLK